MKDGWVRVSRERHCPICDKPDWCMIHESGEVCVCPRVAEGAVKDLGDAGYLHRLKESDTWTYRRIPDCERKRTERKPETRITKWDDEYESMTETDEHNAQLASRLGIDAAGLKRMKTMRTRKGFTAWPMRNEKGITIGFRIRADDGRKWAWPGSHNGLFLPSCVEMESDMIICEGPTDAAAMCGLGVQAMGRPNCNACVDMIVDYCKIMKFGSVTIIADQDGPGYEGAKKLADRLWPMTYSLRVMLPPYTKDARAWVSSGLTLEQWNYRHDACLGYHPLRWRQLMHDPEVVPIAQAMKWREKMGVATTGG